MTGKINPFDTFILVSATFKIQSNASHESYVLEFDLIIFLKNAIEAWKKYSFSIKWLWTLLFREVFKKNHEQQKLLNWDCINALLDYWW